MGEAKGQVFYPALAVTISATGFAGFFFTYFSPIIGGAYPPSGAWLHVHGWSFFLWYLLFPLQALLVARRSYGLHRTLGRWSPALVVLMTATGVLVLSVRVAQAIPAGGPPVWLMYGPLILSNLVLFVSFYAAGVRMALAGRFEAHQRLMIVGSAIALGAGAFRLVMVLTGHPLSLPIGVLGCGVFIVAGIVHDAVTRGTVHPVYWIGLAAMLVVEVSLLPQINPDGVAWINQGLAAVGEPLGFLYSPEPTVEF